MKSITLTDTIDVPNIGRLHSGETVTVGGKISAAFAKSLIDRGLAYDGAAMKETKADKKGGESAPAASTSRKQES